MEINRRDLKNEICSKEGKSSCKHCESEIKKECNRKCNFVFSLINETAYDVIEEIKLNFLADKIVKKKITYSKIFKYLDKIQ